MSVSECHWKGIGTVYAEESPGQWANIQDLEIYAHNEELDERKLIRLLEGLKSHEVWLHWIKENYEVERNKLKKKEKKKKSCHIRTDYEYSCKLNFQLISILVKKVNIFEGKSDKEASGLIKLLKNLYSREKKSERNKA